MSTHYRHLTLDDRIEIELRHEHGESHAQIARRLGVHRSTIGREIRRNSWQPEHDHANLRPYLRNKLDARDPHERLYLAGQAQLHANRRAARSHRPDRMTHHRLVDWVVTHLRRGWTPEEISGRLTVEFPDDRRMRVSVETLYAWIYAPAQQHRGLFQYLARGQKKRRRKRGRRVRTERIKYRVSIHERPQEVHAREEFGHWESDSVVGALGSGGIHTTIERVSRYYLGVKLSAVAAGPTLQAQLGLYRGLSAHAVRSITADNGSEFAHHCKLADTIGCRPTSVTRTRHTSGARTSISMAGCVSISRRAQVLRR